jgi:hypothetical protein
MAPRAHNCSAPEAPSQKTITDPSNGLLDANEGTVLVILMLTLRIETLHLFLRENKLSHHAPDTHENKEKAPSNPIPKAPNVWDTGHKPNSHADRRKNAQAKEHVKEDEATSTGAGRIQAQHWRLTVKLRGRTEAPALGAEGAQSLGARGAKPEAHHGPLQRLLEAGGPKGLAHDAINYQSHKCTPHDPDNHHGDHRDQ